jgi:hypothetical protein
MGTLSDKSLPSQGARAARYGASVESPPGRERALWVLAEAIAADLFARLCLEATSLEHPLDAATPDGSTHHSNEDVAHERRRHPRRVAL